MRSSLPRWMATALGSLGMTLAAVVLTACGAWPTAPSPSQAALTPADIAGFVTDSSPISMVFPPLASTLLRARAFNSRTLPCPSGTTGIASSLDGTLSDSGNGQMNLNGQIIFANCVWGGAVFQGDGAITLSGQVSYVNSVAATPFAIGFTNGVTFTYRNAPGRLQYNCAGRVDGDPSRFRISFSGTVTIEYPIGTAPTTVPCSSTTTTDQPVSSELAAHNCSEEGSTKSLQGTTATSIDFNNVSSTPRSIYWLDYSGQRQFYRRLDPLAHYVQATFLTHPWLVTDASENCLAIYLPSAQLGTAVLH